MYRKNWTVEEEELLVVLEAAGYSDREIAVELDTNIRSITTKKSSLKRGNTRRKYTDDDLLDILRLSGTYSIRSFEKIPGMPSVKTYQNRFGSWNAAVERAGGVPISIHDGVKKYSNEKLLQILLDNPGKTREEFRNDKTLPDPSTYTNRFGSWTKALEMVGLPTGKSSLTNTHVYLIHFIDEDFYKVGITQQGIRQRFYGHPKYEVLIDMVFSNLEDAKIKEQEWLYNVKDYIYSPINFPQGRRGQTECFKLPEHWISK